MSEEKVTAVYVMVRNDELRAEDGGSYEQLLALQKEECFQFLKDRFGEEHIGPLEYYERRRQLLMDVDRKLIKRIVVKSLDRLAATEGDLEGIQFELKAGGVELLAMQ